MSIILELRSKYDSLSRTNQRIVDLIFKDSSAFIEHTAVQLGELTKTSSASIIRFVHAFGFRGLDEFKIELAKEISSNEDVLNISPGITQEDSLESLCQKLQLLMDQTNKDVFYQLNPEALQKAIDVLRQADTVYVFGIGASSLPAYDIFHKLNRVNKHCMFSFDSHMNVEFLHYVKPNDCVIVYSYSGKSFEVIQAAKIARAQGVELIVVTRDSKSPLRELATILLTVPNNEPAPRVGAIASKFSMMLVTDLLYLGLIKNDLLQVEKQLIETSKLTSKMKYQ